LDRLEIFLLMAPVLLFSVVAHEYAHGAAALRQGDPTAYQLGRLTWNPIKHIDPFMTILLPIMTYFFGGIILGGAKPVPVNPRNYRQYKRGDIIVSLAGVATNLVIALACIPLFVLLGILGQATPAAAPSLAIAQQMLVYGVVLNLILIAFNLLPIPPLDGSHVMKYLLPPAWALKYQQIGAYGLLILILLLYIGGPLLRIWMGPALAFGQFLLTSVSGFGLPSPLTS
jgi:Zn-dependent protease